MAGCFQHSLSWCQSDISFNIEIFFSVQMIPIQMYSAGWPTLGICMGLWKSYKNVPKWNTGRECNSSREWPCTYISTVLTNWQLKFWNLVLIQTNKQRTKVFHLESEWRMYVWVGFWLFFFLPGFCSSKCQVKSHLITYFTQVTEVPGGNHKKPK